MASPRITPRLCALVLVSWFLIIQRASSASTNKSCDSVDRGYTCSPEISHYWGQYSLYFSVPSDIDRDVPRGCSVTFAQILSRHGGRDPTAGKTTSYNNTVKKIQQNTRSYAKEYDFIKNYTYTLGADQLTDAGRTEMVYSGIRFYRRYQDLVSKNLPFVRSSGQDRVIESANKWLQGFAQAAQLATPPAIDLSIPEASDVNNTLSHEICTAFEDGPISDIGNDAQDTFGNIFLPPIQSRLNSKLVGANLTLNEALYMMDLCPFNTVGDPAAKVSQFCDLFSKDEWHQYDYYQTLGKWYGYSTGNPLGPTQGVGFVNELIARLTGKPVVDHTSTNTTLDSSNATFPLNRKVYADFSHDNDMSAIFGALGLYNSTKPLSNTTVEGTDETNGYSAAWTVPFAARAYFEKLQCQGEQEEYVRVIVNDRVNELEFCDGDKYGRCKLSKFVDGLSFARSGGHWDQCFA